MYFDFLGMEFEALDIFKFIGLGFLGILVLAVFKVLKQSKENGGKLGNTKRSGVGATEEDVSMRTTIMGGGDSGGGGD